MGAFTGHFCHNIMQSYEFISPCACDLNKVGKMVLRTGKDHLTLVVKALLRHFWYDLH